MPADIVHDMAAFAASKPMFHHHTNPGNHWVFRLVCGRACLASRLLLRLLGLQVGWGIALQTRGLQEDTAGRTRRGFLVPEALSRHTARLRAAQRAHASCCHGHDEVVFDRIRFVCRSRGGLAWQPLWGVVCAARRQQG
jgi:hypothetical protein